MQRDSIGNDDTQDDIPESLSQFLKDRPPVRLWRKVDPSTDVRELEKEIEAYPKPNPTPEYKRRLIMQVNYIRRIAWRGVI